MASKSDLTIEMVELIQAHGPEKGAAEIEDALAIIRGEKNLSTPQNKPQTLQC